VFHYDLVSFTLGSQGVGPVGGICVLSNRTAGLCHCAPSSLLRAPFSALRLDIEEPFPKELGIAEKIRQAALEKNVLTYPSQGTVDGTRGDHVLLAPPFIITPEECQLIADALQYALGRVFPA
jgi:hypothetical protein